MKKILEDLENKTGALFQQHTGSHDWEHTKRVCQLCERIGKKEKVNMNILRVAAILHDIGRTTQDRSKGKLDHAAIGAIMAQRILSSYHVSLDTITAVCHCIASHRFRGDGLPQTNEAKVLYDADKLDSIGAVGIGRAFLFAGEQGANLHDKQIIVEQTKEYSKEDTAYREFLVKLRFIKDKMFTREGKRIAQERHRYMSFFFNRLNKEVDAEL